MTHASALADETPHTAQAVCARATALVEHGEFSAADKLLQSLPMLLANADEATMLRVGEVLARLRGQAETFRAARRHKLLALRQTKGAIDSYRNV